MSRRPADLDDPGRLLLLDLDGTLVDTEADLRACANRMLDARGLAPLRSDEIRPMIGDGLAMLVRRALEHRDARFEQRALDDFVADYDRNAADASTLFPGIQGMLGRALQDGWRLAVCTNKPIALTRSLLSTLGIAHLFAAICGGDSFAVRKPDPGHVRLTMQAAGGVPERSLMLGDHRNDVLAAHGAGIRTIFAGWGYGDRRMAAGAAAIAATPFEVQAIASRLFATAPFAGRRG